MSSPRHLARLALIGNYPPRRCGIATFSADVWQSLTERYPGLDFPVVAVADRPGIAFPPEVRQQIAEREIGAYRKAAEFINRSGARVVSLQHEYGIYGGPAGSHLLALLRNLRVPVVTTLHTVLEQPRPSRRRVLNEIARRSARLIVMTQRGQRLLEEVHGIDPARVDVIPHGIPDVPFLDPEEVRTRLGMAGRRVLLTFGLLSAAKGIEHVIRAMPAIVAAVPEALYVVLGATHPNVRAHEGETYRRKLQRLVARLGLRRHVLFCNRYVGIAELKEYLCAADIYVTPYLSEAQITSGTLAYAFGCGKAVISTPYWHAEELLAEGRGVLVPFARSEPVAHAAICLLQDEARLDAMRTNAYRLGRDMIWPRVAEQYMASFQRALVAPALISEPLAS